MGRSFLSTRQGVNIIADRWVRIARRLGGGCRDDAGWLVVVAKQHSSEGFVGCNDPLEAVIFSALVELVQERGPAGQDPEGHVDP